MGQKRCGIQERHGVTELSSNSAPALVDFSAFHFREKMLMFTEKVMLSLEVAYLCACARVRL